MKKFTLIPVLALLLSACGGGSGGDMPVVTTPPVTNTADAYTKTVDGIATAQSDSAEPDSVDAQAATAPEDNEPVAVM
ncbi:MAG: hypothetical protein V4805_14800 [Pseudomonadota bacterium]